VRVGMLGAVKLHMPWDLGSTLRGLARKLGSCTFAGRFRRRLPLPDIFIRCDGTCARPRERADAPGGLHPCGRLSHRA